MDKAVIAQIVEDELGAAEGCLAAAMNGLAGPYGRTYGRCVSDFFGAFARETMKLLDKAVPAQRAKSLRELLGHFEKLAIE